MVSYGLNLGDGALMARNLRLNMKFEWRTFDVARLVRNGS